MSKHVALCFALSAGLVGAGTLGSPATARAEEKAQKPAKGKKAKKAKKAKPGAPAGETTEEAAEAAQEEVEDRKAPAQFGWAKPLEGGADMDSRADQKRDEAIEKLKKLLPTISEGPDKAEVVFRLSEMYWTKSRYLSMRAMQVWDQQLEQWNAGGGKGPQPTLEKIAEHDQAQLYKGEALKLYERILEQYPAYQRKDEVYYNLGQTLYEGGDKKRGVEMYWALLKQFPDSKFSPDAWLQLGEHFFNANKLAQAVKAYEKAAETKKPRIYSFALYKLAWCDYNLQEYDAALKKFRDVIAYAKAQKSGTDAAKGDIAERDRVQLVDEALSDMVRAYSHLDAVEDAFDYYTGEVGKEKSYRYLVRLARKYSEEGKFALEIKTYSRLNNDFPYEPNAPGNQTAIMNAYAQLGKNEEVRKEVRRLIDLYSPNGVWAKKNSANERVLTQAFDAVEEELSKLVTEQHRAAQQTKLVETYMLARDIYKEYLDKFTTSENAYRFRFFYSEILFELKEFEKAAEQYGLVAAANEKGEFAKAASYTAILAWEKVLSGDKEELGKKITESKRGKAKGQLAKLEQLEELEKGKTYAEKPLSNIEQKLADACDTFVKISPVDDEVVKVKFKSARLYYINNQFEKAAERFGEIIDRFPKDALARTAAESILQSFNVRSDWAQLNQWSRKFAKNENLMADKDFAKNTAALVEGASFNEIMFVYEPKGDVLDTAKRYEGFADEFPKSKYAMVGAYNSIVSYDKSNLLEKSIAMAERVLTAYADFKISDEDVKKSEKDGAKLPQPLEIREKVLFMMGGFWERVAEFDKAAGYYEQFAKEFAKAQRRDDALFNAGLFREGLGQFDAALANFNAYIADYAKKADVPDIAWRIGLIHEKKADWKASQTHFASYGSKWGSADRARLLCADYKVIQALKAQGKAKEVTTAWDGIIKGYAKLTPEEKQKPCALEAMGAAAFAGVEPDFESYYAITLTGSEKEIGQKLLKKLDLVEQLQKRYTDVLGVGAGDYGIASLFRIGQMYQQLAKAIFDTPCPKKLDEDQCAIYQAALQEKAFPLEEKAIEAFDKGLAKAYELGLYNDWLAKSQDALKTYEPGRFPEVHTYELIASESVFEVPQLVEVAK